MIEFPPVVDDNCRVLILGPEPGRTALRTGTILSAS